MPRPPEVCAPPRPRRRGRREKQQLARLRPSDARGSSRRRDAPFHFSWWWPRRRQRWRRRTAWQGSTWYLVFSLSYLLLRLLVCARLVQERDGGVIEFELCGAGQVVELFDAGRAGDRRRDAGPRHQPPQSHLRRCRLMFFRYLVERLQNAKAAIVQIFLCRLPARAPGQIFL